MPRSHEGPARREAVGPRELASFLGATQPKRPFGFEQGVLSTKGANPQAG